MHISNIALRNFKRFNETSVDLSSKITVLVGPNSSGKSSILKALLAMKQTASPTNENEALATQGDFVDLGVYKDYIYNHDITRRLEISLSLKGEDFPLPKGLRTSDEMIFGVKLGHDHVTEQSRVFEISINNSIDNEPIFTITKKITRDSFSLKIPPTSAERLLKGLKVGEKEYQSVQKVWTSGVSLRVDDRYQIAPETPKSGNASTFDYAHYPIFLARTLIQSVFRTLDRDIFYIGPLRRSPSRSYGRTGHLLSVGPAGEHTPSVLANLKARAAKERSVQQLQRKRLSQLQSWMEKLFPGRSVDAKSLDELVKLMIGRENSQGEAISDVGFGISQILPILVQMAVMPDNSSLLLEQPELHLHPSAQTTLAEIIASASESGRRFIVETHSEHFVRGLQLAVSNEKAKKRNSARLKPEEVSFLYVPASPKRPETLKLNEWGEFTTEWPKGFFDEGYRLTMQLLENKMRGISKLQTTAIEGQT